jgi:hypothetical protein
MPIKQLRHVERIDFGENLAPATPTGAQYRRFASPAQ